MPRCAAPLASTAIAMALAGCGSHRGGRPDASAACDASTAGCEGSSDAGVSPRSGVTVLATRQARPGVLAVDADAVYWMNWDLTRPVPASRLMKCQKTGCEDAPTVLAEGPWTNAANLVVQGQALYWGGTGGVLKCSTNGCAGGPTVVASGMGPVGDVAVDPAGRVFYATIGAPTQAGVLIDDPGPACAAVACNDAGSSSAALGSHPPIEFPGSSVVVVDDVNVYVAGPATGEGLIVGCALSGCASSVLTLSSFDTPVFLSPLVAINSTDVYLVGLESFASGEGFIQAVPKELFRSNSSLVGTTPVVQGLSSPTAIAVDETTLYIAELGDSVDDAGVAPAGAGRVITCPVSGCARSPQLLQDYLDYPSGIAVDDANVYWTEAHASGDTSVNNDGRVVFHAK